MEYVDLALGGLGTALAGFIGYRVFLYLSRRQSVEPLPLEEANRLEAPMGQARRASYWVIGIIMPIAAVALPIALYDLHGRFERSPVEPIVFNNRPAHRIIFFVAGGIFFSVVPSLLAARAFLHIWLGVAIKSFDRFERARTGRHPWRGTWTALFIIVPFSACLLWLGWQQGVLIDKRGMVWSDGVTHVGEADYDDVTGIKLYQRVNAPLGIFERPNLVIRFENGTELRLGMKRGKSRLRKIAEYASKRSEVAIEEGDILP